LAIGPSRSYLVCATQRSGSTLLCELLKATGVAGCPEEFFEALRDTARPPHPGDYLDGLPRTGAGVRDDPTAPEAPAYSSLAGIENYRDHLERTFRWGTTDNGVFGAKLMYNQLAELRALAATLPEYAGLPVIDLLTRLFGDPTYVWVSRADKVRQAVSLWRALQTRSWRHGGGRGDTELHYRFEAIDHLVRLFSSEDEAWQALFSEHGIDALRVGYEQDLERDPDGTVRAVLRHVGVTVPEGWRAKPPIARQADALSAEWVATYHRDRADRLSDPGAATAVR
jgi:LPS sulfotransferase NodH